MPVASSARPLLALSVAAFELCRLIPPSCHNLKAEGVTRALLRLKCWTGAALVSIDRLSAADSDWSTGEAPPVSADGLATHS